MNLTNRLRNMIACYGAAIAINLELVTGLPSSTPQQPDPLVRIDDERHTFDIWHPKEIVDQGAGSRFVVVWDLSTGTASSHDYRVVHSN